LKLIEHQNGHGAVHEAIQCEVEEICDACSDSGEFLFNVAAYNRLLSLGDLADYLIETNSPGAYSLILNPVEKESQLVVILEDLSISDCADHPLFTLSKDADKMSFELTTSDRIAIRFTVNGVWERG
jgi:hypothetical protein